MDNATTIRGLIVSALDNFKFRGQLIPIYDEVAPSDKVKDSWATIKDGRSRVKVCVIMQDQQEVPYSESTCSVVTANQITLRVITKWEGQGRKKVSEDIAHKLLSKLRDARGEPLVSGVHKINLKLSRGLKEAVGGAEAYTKVISLEFII